MPRVSLRFIVVVVLIVAAAIRIAMPVRSELTHRARVTALVDDLLAVRDAAFAHFDDHEAWPPDYYPGVTPPELRPYLPAGFTFSRDDILFDWQHWVLPDGTPLHPETQTLIGISLMTEDAALGEAILDRVGGTAVRFSLGQIYTFIIIAW